MKNYDELSRAQLVRERARYPLAQKRIAEVDAKLVDLDRELDAAVEQHGRDCAPVQAKLAEIEDAQIASITDRQPLDEAQEQRRKNLLAEIERANLLLETIRDDVERRRRVIKAEREAAVADLPAVNVIETTLVRTGDPDKQQRRNSLNDAIDQINNSVMFGLRRAVAESSAELESAKEKKYGDAVEVCSKKLTRLTIVHKAIAGAVDNLRAESQQIYRELIEA